MFNKPLEKNLKNDIKRFLLLSTIGFILKNINLQIPGTPAVIEISSICIFLGIVFFQRKWMTFLVMLIISFPALDSSLSIIQALIGNLLYFIPFILMMWLLYFYASSHIKNFVLISVIWGGGILIGYQLFTTPIIWMYLGFLENDLSIDYVLEGILSQPFLVESMISATISSSLVLVALNDSSVKDSRNHFLTILNSLHDGVIAINKKGIIEYLNPVAKKVIKKECDDCVGSLLEDVYKSEYFINLEYEGKTLLDIIKSSENDGQGHLSKIVEDDTTIYLHERFSVIRDDRGSLTGIIITFKDITESESQRILLEEKVKESEIFLKAAVDREEKIKELKETLKLLENGN